MTRRIIQVFEHDELRKGECIDGIKIEQKDRDILSRVHRQTQGKYFDLIDQGVKFKQHVGVLKAGSLVIEILPKGDKGAQKYIPESGKLPWRELFVQVLVRVGYLPTELGPKSSVLLKYGSLVDLYTEHFLHEVRYLCRQGLIKTYIPREKTRPALKGQIRFSKQATAELRGKVGFVARSSEYERGHILNRLLLTTLIRIQESGLSFLTNDALPELLGYLETVEPLRNPLEALKSLKFDRNSERYRKSIDLAKPILLSSVPGVQAGTDETFAMFFDMNRIWERYIVHELRRHAQPLGIKIAPQVSVPLWETRKIRPDIVVTLPSGEKIVIDTKWKSLNRPDPSDEDLRQMFAYNHQINCSHSILLYPDIHGIGGRGGAFVTRPLEREHGCSVLFVRVWAEKEGRICLNLGVGGEVLGMLVTGKAMVAQLDCR